MGKATQIQAGTLRHRVRVESLTEVPRNSFGAPARTWATFATRWASVTPLGGRELFEAQQVYPEVDYIIKMRWLEGATSKMRAVFKGRVFDIAAVRVLEERRVETHLICKATGPEAA